MQGLLEKQPSLRLDWPQLLDHPFLAETAADKERLARDTALAEQKGAEAAGVGATPTLLSRVQSRTGGGGGGGGGAGGAGQGGPPPPRSVAAALPLSQLLPACACLDG
jgi:hypothetical protein